jgi:hypothetical protein
MWFPLNFNGEIRTVRKLKLGEWEPAHLQAIAQCAYEDKCLILPNNEWASLFLGAGEEKAVFCLCDAQQRVFALEVIDERTYLNGRFVAGIYYGETRVPTLTNVPFNVKSQFGLKFTGKVLAREFVYGYEWSRFQFDAWRESWLDSLLTGWLQAALGSQFGFYKAHFKDVHDRNIMFEIRPSSAKGVPILMKDWTGKIRLARIGLQPIDVR